MSGKTVDGSVVARKYKDFRGVDFSSDDTQTELFRSPNGVNVWKDYNSSLGQAIETRVGFRILKHIDGVKIVNIEKAVTFNKIHTFKIDDKPYFLVHVAEYDTTSSSYKGKLYQWSNFPNEPTELTLLKSDIGFEKSTGFVFDKKYYFLDGIDYFRISVGTTGLEIANVAEKCFVPTTYLVDRSGVGKAFQDFNILTGKQKNQFTGSGSKTDFTVIPFDVNEPTTIDKVSIDGTEVTKFTYADKVGDKMARKLTFTTAPVDLSAIVVEFSQKIQKSEVVTCDKVAVFDNRVFFANCPTSKTKYFWTALNNAEYIPSLAFEYAGNEELEVSSLILMADSLALIKNGNGQNGYIFNITAVNTSDGTLPKAYRASLISSSVGGFGEGINFLNDVVFVSRQGVKAISRLDLHNERNIDGRSSMIDGKFVNEINLNQAKCVEFKGYLLVLINGHIYLADSRQRFQNGGAVEYEWYFWDNIGVFQDKKFVKATAIEVLEDKLYFGTENGCLCVFNSDMLKLSDDGVTAIETGELRSEAYSDKELVTENGELVVLPKAIYSCWNTAMDDFNYRNRFKRCNKKGAMADLKSFSHSICKLAIKTNKVPYVDIGNGHNGGYFDFGDIDFEDFTFNTDEKNVFYFKPKNKKWERISLKFYSDEVNKPFGVFGTTIEAYVMGYAKGG